LFFAWIAFVPAGASRPGAHNAPAGVLLPRDPGRTVDLSTFPQITT
jgi:hypothetical protein